MVVIVLLFILIIGILFYYNATKQGVLKEAREREDVAAVTLAKNVLNLPEVACSTLVGRQEGCVDEGKLRALGEILADRENHPDAWELYRRRFGYATINITTITTGGVVAETPSSYVLYHNEPDVQHAKSVQFLFTTLYNPLARTNDLAYITVTRYTKVMS